MTYKVTLVHRIKDEVEANSPEEALQIAIQNNQGAFLPNSWTIRGVSAPPTIDSVDAEVIPDAEIVNETPNPTDIVPFEFDK